jgi:hypothetical protein
MTLQRVTITEKSQSATQRLQSGCVRIHRKKGTAAWWAMPVRFHELYYFYFLHMLFPIQFSEARDIQNGMDLMLIFFFE